MVKETIGQRGKTAEKAVKDLLTRLNVQADLAWFRTPDARAARGTLAASPADFLVAVKGKVLWWEVKSTQHPFRLRRDAVSQLPTLKKFRMAGMEYVVLVFHTEERLWRVVKGQWLEVHGGASWALDKHKAYVDLLDALKGEGVL